MSSILHLSILCALGLFGAMLGALELGRRIRVRRREAAGATGPGAVAVESAVFALLGLLLAFTFTGAASRFDARRDLVLHEANAIGTAWLRLDVLPAPDRPVLRDKFRAYLRSRIDTYRHIPDLEAVKAELGRSIALQGEIWALATASAARDGRPQVATLVLPALNEMFDLANARVHATRMHVPMLIVGLLMALAVLAALLAGHDMGTAERRDWPHRIVFAAVTAIALYVILDLEFPRVGLIRLDTADQVLLDLQQSME